MRYDDDLLPLDLHDNPERRGCFVWHERAFDRVDHRPVSGEDTFGPPKIEYVGVAFGEAAAGEAVGEPVLIVADRPVVVPFSVISATN